MPDLTLKEKVDALFDELKPKLHDLVEDEWDVNDIKCYLINNLYNWREQMLNELNTREQGE